MSHAASAVRRTRSRPQFWFGLLVLVPTFIWYTAFGYFPILRGLFLAVVDYDPVSRELHGFAGLDNFAKQFESTKKEWCVLGDNCHTAVSDALSACGLSMQAPTPPSPRFPRNKPGDPF